MTLDIEPFRKLIEEPEFTDKLDAIGALDDCLDEIDRLRTLLDAAIDIATDRECSECFGPGGTCRCQLLRFMSEGQYDEAIAEINARAKELSK